MHHAWQSNVWEMTDFKFTATAKTGGRVGETVRQKIERRERTRMQLGRREKDKQHVWASNHQLTLFICCVVSVSPSTHRGFVWTHQNSQKKQSERKKKCFLRETPASAFCLTFSFFHFSLCNITSPLCPDFIAPPPLPNPTPLLSVSLSASPLRSRVGSWEQKAGDWQDKSCFLILQLSSPLLSRKKTASQDREFPARCIPAQLLSLTGRQAKREEVEKDREKDGYRGRKTGESICRRVEKEADRRWSCRPSLWPLW